MESIKKYFSIPNFNTIFGGLLLAQIFNLLNLFILPRLYNPKDFAIFGLFTSFVFILIEIITLKLDIAIQLSEKNKRIALTQTAIFVAFFLSLIIAVFSITYVILKGNYFFLMLPVVTLAYGINQSLMAWQNSEHQNNTITAYRIIVVVVNFIIASVCMYFYKISIGLIWGFVSAQIVSSLFLIYKSRIVFDKIISKVEFKEVIVLSQQFPKFGVASSLINTISQNSIIPLIVHFFGNTLGGFYTMGAKVVATPSGLYQTAMTQIFIQQATKLSKQELRLLSLKILVFGSLLGLIPNSLVLCYGKDLFAFIFGQEWQTAGNIASYIVLWYYSTAIINPINFTLDIYKKLNIELIWNMFLLIFRIGSLFIGFYFQNFWMAIILLTTISIIMNILLLTYSFRLLKK